MTCQTFRHADLIPLAGSITAIRGLSSNITSAGDAFTVLSAAADVPPPLRRYYAKVGKKLTVTGTRLEQDIKLAKHDALNLKISINSTLERLRLSEEELARLCHVNTRLLELEKSLEQMVAGMRERLEGLDPSDVEWDEWDGFDIILWPRIGPDPERPAYDPDAWAITGIMKPLEIRAEIWESWRRFTADDKEPWGLDDGRNHSEFAGCDGYPEYSHQCYLFHELHDHAHVGLWGMLNLQALRIEITPSRSGSFHI
jgi:hypothetical protein